MTFLRPRHSVWLRIKFSKQVIFYYFSVLFIAVGLFLLLTSLQASLAAYTPLFPSEEWPAIVESYLKLKDGHLGAIFEEFNFHRYVLMRLFWYLDFEFLGGNRILHILLSYFFQFLTFLCLLKITNISLPKSGSKPEKLFLAGVSLIFLFSWLQQENFLEALQMPFLSVSFFALTSYFFLFQFKNSTKVTNLTLCIASSLLALLSMASGYVAFLVLIIQAIILEKSRKNRFILSLIVGLFSSLLVFLIWHYSPGGTLLIQTFTQSLSSKLQLLTFNLLILARAPLFNSTHNTFISDISGFIFYLAAGAVILDLLLNQKVRSNPVSVLGFHLLFHLGSIILIAASAPLNGSVSPRYLTVILTAWLCIILYSSIRLNTITLKIPLWIALALSISCFLSYQQQHAINADWSDRLYRRHLAMVSLKMGFYIPELADTHLVRDNLLSLSARLEKLNKAYFRTPWLAEIHSIQPQILVPIQKTCSGKITGWAQVTSQNRLLEGTVGMAIDVPKLIVFTNDHYAPIGYGVSGKKTHWSGFTKSDYQPSHIFLVKSQKDICKIL